MTALLDAYGRPLPAKPAKPVEAAEIARIPQPAQHFASQSQQSYTLQRILSTLREAVRGESLAYLSLAEDIEERNLHYYSLLQTRKLKVCGLTPEILPGDDSEQAQTIADEFQQRVVETEAFYSLKIDLMDAIAKGYSVVQAVWDTTTRPWTFKAFDWQDPRLFMFDPDTLSELRWRNPSYPYGQPIPPGQYIIHRPKLRTGITLRAGVARLAAIAYLFKSPALTQWGAFLEVFGMPLRLAKYDPATMGEKEIAALKRAVVNIAHDAAAIIPEGASLEILDGRRPGMSQGSNLFEGMANYWDAQLSKAILGQTMTTDDGASLSQAQVHDSVRDDIAKADGLSLDHRLRADVATPWTRYNYGAEAPVPIIHHPVDPPEDLQAFSAAVTPLIVAGMPVDWQEIREKFGLRQLSTQEIQQMAQEKIDNAKAMLDATAPKNPPPGKADAA